MLAALLIQASPSRDVFAQSPPSTESQNKSVELNDPFSGEIKPNQINPEFFRKWSFNSKTAQPDDGTVQKQVRMIYLVPSDKLIRDDYKAAVADAILHLQDFYQKELGNNYAFSLHSPIVEVYQTTHSSAYYQTHQSGSTSAQSQWFYENTLADGFALTGGSFDDPNNRWIYYIDADPLCGQGIGGTHGIAVLSGNDFRGLTGGQNFPRCPGQEGADTGGKYRWIGGLGHELGHAFNLPHPPGCDAGSCQGGQTAYFSLMYVGYAYYPNTYFLPENKQALLSSGFFTQLNLNPAQFFDFDGDRSADISVWRPGDGVWYTIKSSNGAFRFVGFGQNGDKIVPGDYDGDGKTDEAVWRPSDGVWYILRSSDNTYYGIQFGVSSDTPVAADYDGDRRTDIAVWRPGSGTWYIIRSATDTIQYFQFGTNGDKPVPADYNGDKRTDVAVFRPSENVWFIYNNYPSYYYANPQVSVSATGFGFNTDKLVPADYDGDKKADIAVWRPSNGTFYYLNSSTGYGGTQWGVSGDIPTPADFDGDGKIDFAVWRPGDTYFYILQSSSGNFRALQWGVSSDIPAASAFVR